MRSCRCWSSGTSSSNCISLIDHCEAVRWCYTSRCTVRYRAAAAALTGSRRIIDRLSRSSIRSEGVVRVVAARLVLLRHLSEVGPPPFTPSLWLVVGQEDQDADKVEDYVGPPYAQSERTADNLWMGTTSKLLGVNVLRLDRKVQIVLRAATLFSMWRGVSVGLSHLEPPRRRASESQPRGLEQWNSYTCYCTMICTTFTYYIILYHIILYYIIYYILYFILLHSIILNYIILYYVILYSMYVCMYRCKPFPTKMGGLWHCFTRFTHIVAVSSSENASTILWPCQKATQPKQPQQLIQPACFLVTSTARSMAYFYGYHQLLDIP